MLHTQACNLQVSAVCQLLSYPMSPQASSSSSSAYAFHVQFLYYMSSFWALYGSHTTSFLLSAEVRHWAQHQCLPGLLCRFNHAESASSTERDA